MAKAIRPVNVVTRDMSRAKSFALVVGHIEYKLGRRLTAAELKRARSAWFTGPGPPKGKNAIAVVMNSTKENTMATPSPAQLRARKKFAAMSRARARASRAAKRATQNSWVGRTAKRLVPGLVLGGLPIAYDLYRDRRDRKRLAAVEENPKIPGYLDDEGIFHPLKQNSIRSSLSQWSPSSKTGYLDSSGRFRADSKLRRVVTDAATLYGAGEAIGLGARGARAAYGYGRDAKAEWDRMKTATTRKPRQRKAATNPKRVRGWIDDRGRFHVMSTGSKVGRAIGAGFVGAALTRRISPKTFDRGVKLAGKIAGRGIKYAVDAYQSRQSPKSAFATPNPAWTRAVKRYTYTPAKRAVKRAGRYVKGQAKAAYRYAGSYVPKVSAKTKRRLKYAAGTGAGLAAAYGGYRYRRQIGAAGKSAGRYGMAAGRYGVGRVAAAGRAVKGRLQRGYRDVDAGIRGQIRGQLDLPFGPTGVVKNLSPRTKRRLKRYGKYAAGALGTAAALSAGIHYRKQIVGSRVGRAGAWGYGKAAGAGKWGYGKAAGAWGKLRGNPEGVEDLYETFSGVPPTEVIEVLAPQGTPEEIAALGELVSLKTKEETFEFEKGEAILAADVDGTLHVITPVAVEPNQDFGKLEVVNYKAAKPHIEGDSRTREYYHEFGETDGAKPRLVSDGEGSLVIVGGDYAVLSEGITG